MRLAACIIPLALATTAADAHCYSRWYYPWPQHCRGHVIASRAFFRRAPPPIVHAVAQPADPFAIAPADLDKLKAAMKEAM